MSEYLVFKTTYIVLHVLMSISYSHTDSVSSICSLSVQHVSYQSCYTIKQLNKRPLALASHFVQRNIIVSYLGSLNWLNASL